MIDLAPLERHKKMALLASGGKDSTACLYLLRDHLDRIKVYTLDTGDLLPEVRDVVCQIEAMCPHFVRIETNVRAWIAANGLPSDLIPHSAHPVARRMGEERTVLVPRYDCCWHNLMEPLFRRVVEDGNTLLIRGSKSVDMNRLPMASGDVLDGIELWLPIQDWSNDEVFAYLRSVGAPLSRVYDYVTNSPECARCSAWWGEKRAAYLRQYHPALFDDYRCRMTAVMRELQAPLTNLATEMLALGGLADG